MKILHISDLHYRRSYPKVKESYKSFLPNMTSPLVFLEMTSKRVTQDHIDLVITSGDLTDDGDFEDYLELKEMFKHHFGHIPHIIGLGNHDHHALFYKVFDYDFHDKNNYVYFNHVADFNGLRIIVFDNTYNCTPNGSFVQSQLDWLKNVLNESKQYRILLVMHHHLLDMNNQVPAIKVTNEFDKMIEESSIIGIICGHTHHAYEGRYMKKPYALAPSLSFRGVVEKETGDVRFEEYPGYQIIEVDDQNLSFKNYYLLEKPKVLGKLKIIK